MTETKHNKNPSLMKIIDE